MNKVSAESMLSRMKTNNSSFELIPEEVEESMQDNPVVTAGSGFKKLDHHSLPTSVSVGKSSERADSGQLSDNTNVAGSAMQAQAQQAAMAARFLQAQNLSAGANLPPELALHQQLFGHQLLQQKILEEQLARNRDFLLVSEQAEHDKHANQLGLIFHQVSTYLVVFWPFFPISANYTTPNYKAVGFLLPHGCGKSEKKSSV